MIGTGLRWSFDQDEMAKQCFEGTEDNVTSINGENLPRARYEEDGTLPWELSIKTFLDSLKDNSSTDDLSQVIKRGSKLCN